MQKEKKFQFVLFRSFLLLTVFRQLAGNDTVTTLFNTMEQLRTRYNALITSSDKKPADNTAK